MVCHSVSFSLVLPLSLSLFLSPSLFLISPGRYLPIFVATLTKMKSVGDNGVAATIHEMKWAHWISVCSCSYHLLPQSMRQLLRVYVCVYAWPSFRLCTSHQRNRFLINKMNLCYCAVATSTTPVTLIIVTPHRNCIDNLKRMLNIPFVFGRLNIKIYLNVYEKR